MAGTLLVMVKVRVKTGEMQTLILPQQSALTHVKLHVMVDLFVYLVVITLRLQSVWNLYTFAFFSWQEGLWISNYPEKRHW